MLFFIYAIIGMQVGESRKLKIITALLGDIKKFFFLWDKDDDGREDVNDGDVSSKGWVRNYYGSG